MLYLYSPSLRYFWDLGIFSTDQNGTLVKVLDAIGISYPKHLPRAAPGSDPTADSAFESETILFWVLYTFTVVQYRTYKSAIFNQFGVVT